MSEVQRRLDELRQELETNSRLRHLLQLTVKDFADAELRHLYKTNDAAAMIRGTGLAEGAEKFIALITTGSERRSRKKTAGSDLL